MKCPECGCSMKMNASGLWWICVHPRTFRKVYRRVKSRWDGNKPTVDKEDER